MAVVVAGGAAELEVVDEGVAGLLVGGHVVVLQQVGSAAVDGGSVAFFDDPLLAGGGVAVPARGVDGAAVGVVDQRSQE